MIITVIEALQPGVYSDKKTGFNGFLQAVFFVLGLRETWINLTNGFNLTILLINPIRPSTGIISAVLIRADNREPAAIGSQPSGCMCSHA